MAELKKQKAAIEREEGEVSALLREKMRFLQQRLEALGVDGKGVPLPKQEGEDKGRTGPKDKEKDKA